MLALLVPVVRHEHGGQSFSDSPFSDRDLLCGGGGTRRVPAALSSNWSPGTAGSVLGPRRHRSVLSHLAGWTAICGRGFRGIDGVKSAKKFQEFAQRRSRDARRPWRLLAIGSPAVCSSNLAHDVLPSRRGSSLGKVRLVTTLWPSGESTKTPRWDSGRLLVGTETVSLGIT